MITLGNCFLGNDAKNACWCLLCSIGMGVLQAHRIAVVALHLRLFWGIVKYPLENTMIKAYRESC